MKGLSGLFLILAFVFHACALGQAPEGQAKLLRDVPFFAQEDCQCGPAALATVINYWYRTEKMGETLGISEIVRAIYSPAARGVLPVDIENYPKQKGQINHFMVATGYSDNGIFFNSGRKEKEHIDNSSLEKIWKKTGYWALLVTPS